MTRKAELNFWLDLAVFVVQLMMIVTGTVVLGILPHSLTANFLGLSRSVWLAAHVGAGVLGLAGVVLHIVWHRDWLKALRGRSLREMPRKLRANRVVDRAMWLCFIVANVCGALTAALHLSGVSVGVGVPERLHVVFAIVWVVLTIVHLGLHSKWIAATARRCLPCGWQRANAHQQQDY